MPYLLNFWSTTRRSSETSLEKALQQGEEIALKRKTICSVWEEDGGKVTLCKAFSGLPPQAAVVAPPKKKFATSSIPEEEVVELGKVVVETVQVVEKPEEEDLPALIERLSLL